MSICRMILARPAPLDNVVDHFGAANRSDSAWRAFAARFVAEKMHGFVDQPIHAHGIVGDDDRGRTQLGAQGGNAFVIHWGIQRLIVGHD